MNYDHELQYKHFIEDSKTLPMSVIVRVEMRTGIVFNAWRMDHAEPTELIPITLPILNIVWRFTDIPWLVNGKQYVRFQEAWEAGIEEERRIVPKDTRESEESMTIIRDYANDSRLLAARCLAAESMANKYRSQSFEWQEKYEEIEEAWLEHQRYCKD